jgi:ABC-type transporter Mla subunit MlaD
MSTASRNLRLGLFAIAAVVALVVAAVVLGIHAVQPAKIDYHTYFDESVQGLEVGAAVKYRGVRIGSVDAIEIAPDRKHIDVMMGILESSAKKLHLAAAKPGLGTQLQVQGLTGVKTVEIDFFDPQTSPPPVLPFTPAARYIPARTSLITGITADLETLARELPDLVDHAKVTFGKLDRVLDDVHDQELVARAGAMLDRLGSASVTARRVLASVEEARLPDRAKATLSAADQAIADARGVLRRIDGDHGLVASAQRATDSFGELGRRSAASADELDRTLRELGEAAQSVRELADEIEREPDILLKGRERSSRR